MKLRFLSSVFLLLTFFLGFKSYSQDSLNHSYLHINGYSVISIGLNGGYRSDSTGMYNGLGPQASIGIVFTGNEYIGFAMKLGVNTIHFNNKKYVMDEIEEGTYDSGTKPLTNSSFGFTPSVYIGGNFSYPVRNYRLSLKTLIGISALKLPDFELVHPDERFKYTNRINKPGIAWDLSLNLRKETERRYLFFEIGYNHLSSLVTRSLTSKTKYEVEKTNFSTDGFTLSFGFTPSQRGE